jgi:hypothetical protein
MGGKAPYVQLVDTVLMGRSRGAARVEWFDEGDQTLLSGQHQRAEQTLFKRD